MLKLGNERTNKIFEARILNGAEERWVSVNSNRYDLTPLSKKKDDMPVPASTCKCTK